MKFTDRHLNITISLHKLANTEYWHDLEGDLYEVDIYNGLCEKVRACDALGFVLMRQNPNNGYCPICDCKCLKIKASENKSYLTPFDKWFK